MKHSKSFLLLLAMILSSSLVIGDATLTIETNTYNFDIAITNAYYTELNNDGFEDDVVIVFNFNHSNKVKIEVYLEFILTLTSGRQVIYGFQLTVRENTNFGEMYFYNDATELGWYNIRIDVHLFTGKYQFGTLDLNFDPPGGSSGVPPSGELVLT